MIYCRVMNKMLHIFHIVCCIKKVFYSKNVFFKNFLVQEGQNHSESFGAGCVKGKYLPKKLQI